MDQVLQGLRWSCCLVYHEDIISFGTTSEDTLDNLTLFFERLRAYGLQVLAQSGLSEECLAVPGVRGILPAVCPRFCRSRGAPGGFDW